MDKYQKFILEQAFKLNDDVRWGRPHKFHYKIEGFISEKTKRNNCGTFDFENNTITINQDEDINSTVYKHKIEDYYMEAISPDTRHGRRLWGETGGEESSPVKYLSGISIIRDNKAWEPINFKYFGGDEEQYREYELILDFNSRIKKVKFSFDRNLADDYEMDVIYVEADREAYNRKKAEEERQKLITAAKIECKTGASLVNIYFAPCEDDCDRTEIELYKDDRIMAKYPVQENRFYLSINGLAYGSYSFVLKQYSKDGAKIFETDKIVFSIPKPRHGLPSV